MAPCRAGGPDLATKTDFSLAEARRIALAAQGFDRPRPRRVDSRHLRRTIRHLGLLQLDFVNVVAPAHRQVLFSRLGAYDVARLDRLLYGSGEFTEQWAHEASILPVETWPLLRHRMETQRLRPWGFGAFLERHSAYADAVLAVVRERGPLSADDLPSPPGIDRRLPGTWVRSVPRAVLEAYFARGVLAVTERRPDLARRFDLAERWLPAQHRGRPPSRDEAERGLLRLAARAHGIGTAGDLADYYRMPISAARPRLAELVDAGELRSVSVEGWGEPAFLHPAARLPARLAASALLSPFDPVVWFRPRGRRLFSFDYRLEIFVPPAARRWGCYVLPFLFGDRLVARVDLKADRPGNRLRVLGAYGEPGIAAGRVAAALAQELRALASWLGLAEVAGARRGDLARPLAAALRR